MKFTASLVLAGDPTGTLAAPRRDVAARVLVADDDPGLLAAMADALSEAGYLVTRAGDGAALIDAMATGHFDVIVTDIAMPWMTGVQAGHSARYAGLDTPILVITALRDAAIDRQVEALGERTRLLRKPFSLEALETAVARLLADTAPHGFAGTTP